MTYDQETSALLVIDPYNDFISEGGKVWEPPAHLFEMPSDYTEHDPMTRNDRWMMFVLAEHSGDRGWSLTRQEAPGCFTAR